MIRVPQGKFNLLHWAEEANFKLLQSFGILEKVFLGYRKSMG